MQEWISGAGFEYGSQNGGGELGSRQVEFNKRCALDK